MNKVILSVTLVSTSVGTLACRADTASIAPEETEIMVQSVFEEIDWRLLDYRSESGEMKTVISETVIEARFSVGAVAGSAGCNRFFGAYTIENGDQLILGPEIGSTEMACAPEVMSQERRYLALLGQIATFRREKNRLSLLNSDLEPLLSFAVVEAKTLESTDWQATGINNGVGGVVSTATTSMSTAVFADGRVTGHGGCNQFQASYEIDGDQITIGRAMATKKLCLEPEGLMEQENQYFRALAGVRTLALTAERLELRDEGGSLQISFEAPGQ